MFFGERTEQSCLTFQPQVDVKLFKETTCVCIGTGRFLRAVLVPAMRTLGEQVILAQTRGSSFGKYFAKRNGSYEVDVVDFDGSIGTEEITIAGCGTLGKSDGRNSFMGLPAKLPNLRYIGVGVTEAGVSHNGTAMKDLAEFLHSCFMAKESWVKSSPKNRLSIINTDNVPNNGNLIRKYVHACDFTIGVSDKAGFLQFLNEHVVFHNSMVDRIVSHREGNPMVPRTEPLPTKAIVVEDLGEALPEAFASVPGIKVRFQVGEIDLDHALKLRVANAAHSEMVYLMALSRLPETDRCIGHPHVLPFLDQIFFNDIVWMAKELGLERCDIEAVHDEWIGRLKHPFFGLSCFWITQNASTKLGIRLIPNVNGALAAGQTPSPFLGFAIACLIRFLIPMGEQPRVAEGIFRGKLDPPDHTAKKSKSAPFEFTPGLTVDHDQGYYEFRDGDGTIPKVLLGLNPTSAKVDTLKMVTEVLKRTPGFDASRMAHGVLAEQVGDFVHRLVVGERAMDVLATLDPSRNIRLKNDYEVRSVVEAEVQKVQAIDLHTHLFPPAHGSLCLYGIDELLTYHYLVCEFFTTAEIDHDAFFALTKEKQAAQIWQALFVDRSPISEATRGVLTTLTALGLGAMVRDRDLDAIRRWYKAQDPQALVKRVFKLAGLRYCVMTNVPFAPDEAAQWKAGKKGDEFFRSALRIDPLLKGDWEAVSAALKEAGYAQTIDAAKQYLRDWAKVMAPEYLMASTPHDFAYTAGGATAPPVDAKPAAKGGSKSKSKSRKSSFSAPPSAADLLEQVICPIAVELNLPIALKLGAQRALFPALRSGGDGLVVSDVEIIRQLCLGFPRVKFMVTVLSRVNQHELTVMANKFPNLHLYGCWWYCNNPSIITEMTAMRLEILGTGFTCQHSDARVLDQLVYKWIHSRKVVAGVLGDKYADLASTGWQVTQAEIRRDVNRLFGGAMEEFVAKRIPSAQ